MSEAAQADLVQRAARVFPGGVLGSHRSGPGLEFVVRGGRGAHLWDTNVCNQECLRRGVVKAVNKIYVSLAHSDADVAETLGVFDQALAVLAARTGAARDLELRA